MKIVLKCDPTKIKIKENAMNIRSNIGSPWTPDFLLSAYKQHLKDCINCPTRGLIANNQFINSKNEIVETNIHKQNKKRIAKSPQIQYLQAKLKNRINTLYPTTKKIRNYIIKSNRINYDTVTESRKFTLLDKIKLLFS